MLDGKFNGKMSGSILDTIKKNGKMKERMDILKIPRK